MSEEAVVERRSTARPDRRRNARSGRRAGDPRPNWRRLAWLFAVYGACVSLGSLPATVRRWIEARKGTAA